MSEVTLLGQNVNAYGRDLRPDRRDVRAAADGARRARRHAPHPLHEPASEGHARGRDPRARRARRRCASTSTCRCSPARRAILKAMRRTYTRERYLDRVALIREHVPDCRADHRHHRRLPGGDRGGLPRDARGRRRRSATTARSRSSSPRAAAPRPPSCEDRVAHEEKVERMQRLVELVQRRARERAQRFVGRTRRGAGRGRLAHRRRAACAAARATTRSSTSPAWRSPASTSTSRSTAATSQTLTGEQVSLLVPAS